MIGKLREQVRLPSGLHICEVEPGALILPDGTRFVLGSGPGLNPGNLVEYISWLVNYASAAEREKIEHESKLATAFHEAGHAIVARAGGDYVAYLKLRLGSGTCRYISRNGYALGKTINDTTVTHALQYNSLEHDASVAIAGWLGEFLFLNGEAPLYPSLNDLAFYRFACGVLGKHRGQDITQVSHEIAVRTTDMLKRNKNNVIAIAEYFQIHKKQLLEGRSLEKIMRQVH